MAKAKRKPHHSTHHAASHHPSGRHSSHRSSGRHSAHHSNGNGGEHARHATEEMVSAGREQIGRMEKSAFDSLGIFSGPMARIMDQNWSVFQRLIQTMQGESLRFFNRRLEHTSHVIENSRDFQGVSGLMQLHQEWMLDFARDYSEHATRFGQLMREMAADSTERFSEASLEALEESEEELGKTVREEDRAAA